MIVAMECVQCKKRFDEEREYAYKLELRERSKGAKEPEGTSEPNPGGVPTEPIGRPRRGRLRGKP